MDNVRENCLGGCASSLPWPDNHFDLVISINTRHNLNMSKLRQAFFEIKRVSKINKYICVESYRNEQEKVNLLYWQLICHALFTPEDRQFVFDGTGYDSDFGYVYF